MAAEHEPSPGEQPITAEDVELAERRASEARRGAAVAGLAAARSMDESARQHERIADLTSEDRTHAESARGHRAAAKDDSIIAEQKRKESESALVRDNAE